MWRYEGIIRSRIEEEPVRQQERFAQQEKPGLLANADMVDSHVSFIEVQAYCKLDDAGANLMQAAIKQMDLSARAYHRVLKLARTIADLATE